MPLEPRDAASLWDMFNAATAVTAKLKDITLEQYLADEDLRMNIERRIEILGEAARRLSESFRAAHPEIPWRDIIAQRNFLSHVYDEINDARVWQLVKKDIPTLIEQLKPLLPPLPPDRK
jgi:uncharacterized protein with HEPN domain